MSITDIDALNLLQSSPENGAPMIHCLTNPLAIQWMADAILALSARPMMAEHPQEVAAVTAGAGALLLNLGNLTDARMAGIRLAGQTADRLGLPIVLDPVGAAGSPFRLTFAMSLFKSVRPRIIKGNASEIESLAVGRITATGVDALPLSMAVRRSNAAQLAQMTGAVIVTTGPTDLITCAGGVTAVTGGSSMMGRITGSGCLAGAVIAAFAARLLPRPSAAPPDGTGTPAGDGEPADAEPSGRSPAAPNTGRRAVGVQNRLCTAARLAMAVLAEAGEAAEASLGPTGGSGSFRIHLLDQLTLFGRRDPAWPASAVLRHLTALR